MIFPIIKERIKKMERIRVSGIIPMDGGFALMHRKEVKREISEFYAFPGGGLEENETYEEGTIREIKEELGIDVEIIEKLYENIANKFNKKEIYYLCKYIGGKFGTGDGPEFSENPAYVDSGKYIPEIIKREEIEDILLLPQEIRDKFIEDIKKGKF